MKRDIEKSLVDCPKCKRVDGLMWDARPKIWRCVWKDCEYIERPEKPVCSTCGGSRRKYEKSERQMPFGIIGTYVSCPYCQPKEPEPRNDILVMPRLWMGQVYNACTDPCDMLQGPCACGAWHHLEEWIITRKKLTKDGWVNPVQPVRCPFNSPCTGKAVIQQNGTCHYIYCANCGRHTDCEETTKEAILAWNSTGERSKDANKHS